MIKNDFPYNSKNIYYAIHSINKQNISNVRLSQSENQGIYVSPDVIYLCDFIHNMIPPEKIAKELSFYINLNDIEELIKLFHKKLKNRKNIEKILSCFYKSQDYTLWGYFKTNNIKKVYWIKSKNQNDLVDHFIKNKYPVKVFFNLEDLIYLKKKLEDVKHGLDDNYNFIVE